MPGHHSEPAGTNAYCLHPEATAKMDKEEIAWRPLDEYPELYSGREASRKVVVDNGVDLSTSFGPQNLPQRRSLGGMLRLGFGSGCLC